MRALNNKEVEKVAGGFPTNVWEDRGAAWYDSEFSGPPSPAELIVRDVYDATIEFLQDVSRWATDVIRDYIPAPTPPAYAGGGLRA